MIQSKFGLLVKPTLEFHPVILILLRVVNVFLILAHAYVALFLLVMAQSETLLHIFTVIIGVIFLPSILYQISSGLRQSYLFNLFAHGISTVVIAIAIILAVVWNGFPDSELGNIAGISLLIGFGPGAIVSLSLLLLLTLDQPRINHPLILGQDGRLYQAIIQV
ncbi:unnamed protein product [Moneuplotes crassus]|uniref:Uncharacterized protein n=1 Tax=Euplotes crassus TaxID=5936 RepID=A0AAD1Y0C8_EUPCR|nr:unnamed protein product [Moneuplotes crassus]